MVDDKNRITIRLEKELRDKLKEEAESKGEKISTIIRDSLNKQLSQPTSMAIETNKHNLPPRRFFSIGNADIVVGSKLGTWDPYVPFTEQFVIKIIKGKQIMEISPISFDDLRSNIDVDAIAPDWLKLSEKMIGLGDEFKKIGLEWRKKWEETAKKEKVFETNKKKILTIIDDLSDDGLSASLEDVKEKAEENGIENFQEILNELISRNIIAEKDGHLTNLNKIFGEEIARM